MADKAFITPKVLKWARESAKISLEVACAKIHVSAEKLVEWEEGESQPTIRQAEKLANIYRRPFALLFLPDVPNDFLPLQDFRKSDSRELGTGSLFMIREIQQKQGWVSESNQDNGEPPLSFVGKYSINSDSKAVAKDILNTLKINPANYTFAPMKEWITKAEEQGIFISRTSFIHSRLTLDSEEIQGFAIADPYAPFIFVNSHDWDAPQLFTLVHELAHLWIAESGISNDVDMDTFQKGSLHPVEQFCNEVAAQALMPDEIMRSLQRNVFTSPNNVFREAKKLGISSFALLVRALKIGQISLPTYKALKLEADSEFQAFKIMEAKRKAKQKETPGGPNPYLLRLNKNSQLFTQIVLDGFRNGRIAATQASSLLNTQVNNFHKLEAFIYS